MANCKLVHLRGKLPWVMVENEVLKDWLASMNTPSFGLSITWGKEETGTVKGEFATLYPFNITGIEAVNFKAFEALKAAILEIGGEVTTWQVEDMEA